MLYFDTFFLRHYCFHSTIFILYDLFLSLPPPNPTFLLESNLHHRADLSPSLVIIAAHCVKQRSPHIPGLDPCDLKMSQLGWNIHQVCAALFRLTNPGPKLSLGHQHSN